MYLNRSRRGASPSTTLLTLMTTWLALSLCLLLFPLPVSAAAGRVPYYHAIDEHSLGSGSGMSGETIALFEGGHLARGETITVKGWVATSEGIRGYEYLWVPAGGGAAAWMPVDAVQILKRTDLAASGIPYASGHATAGYVLSFGAPAGTEAGYYDVYVRAIDGMGSPCDLVAFLNVRYANPDIDNGERRTVSFLRIGEEGSSALRGNAEVTGRGITIHPGDAVRLGTYPLTAFERVSITYTTGEEGVSAGTRTPVLGLKSAGDHPYGGTGEAYNITDNIAYAGLACTDGTATVEMDLSACTYNGEVWLTGYLGGTLTVTDITFTYDGYATDRVAARIHLSADLLDGYFTGYNQITATGVQDPHLGDVLRMELTENGNDPFVYFKAGSLLADNELILDADEYAYMVLLYRAGRSGSPCASTFYLCAGDIYGATEACTHSFVLQTDGQWHYLLLDLTNTANWSGRINGWRFDIYNGNSNAGDYVEYATVQFFRTHEAAVEAAAEDPAACTAYHSGDPAVIRDMREETAEEDFIMDPDDTYVVTEPETEAPTEPPSTFPAETPPPAETEILPADTRSEDDPKGCASVVGTPWLALLSVTALSLTLHTRQKKSKKLRRLLFDMKRTITALCSLLLVCTFVASTLVTPAVAAPAAESFTDETSRTASEILLSDGTSTGVTLTNVAISGSTYGENREVNIASFSLANTHLSVEVINSGDYMVSSKTLDKAAADYNAAHEGQTVLAAVNGDLWMTAVHSGSSVTTKVLKVPRGVMIVDGEIWASQQIDAENAGAINAEKGTPAGDKAAFGVTSKNQPLVGSPDIDITVTVNGQTLAADGLNRLPAIDSLIVYNHRVNDSNYALKDAYEVELEVEDSSAFTAGGTLTARVVAIYAPGAATRPAIGEKTIVLTARGNKIDALKNTFKVGDTVTFETTLTDRMGRTELWQDVVEAIGGHMQPIIDGKPAVANGDSTAYPTSFIGYRDDGTVAFCTVTSTLDGSRAALRFKDGYQFCTEMGYNSVFYLDGGGSTTFLALEEGSYTIRNKCSDGAARAVINGIAVVWNQEPVCEKQGSLGYIKIPVNMSNIPATYLDGALLAELVGAPNGVNIGYDETEKAFRMTTSAKTNDPYAALEFSTIQRADASEYPYLVFKVKTDHPQRTNFTLYYAAGTDNGAAANRTKTFVVEAGMEEWQYITVDMSKVSNWKGNINNIRLDIFDSVYTEAGVSMYIGAIVLCKTADEAAAVATGWAPEGSITDYLAYLESIKPEIEPETEAPTEPETVTEEATDPATDAPETGEPVTDVTATGELASGELASGSPSAEDTNAVTPAVTDAPTGGCSSVLGGGLCAVLLLLLSAVALVRSNRNRT